MLSTLPDVATTDETEFHGLRPLFAELHAVELELEQQGHHLAVLGLRMGRFDVVMGRGYRLPNLRSTTFRGPEEGQIDVSKLAPIMRGYRIAFGSLQQVVPPVPKLRELGFRPFNSRQQS